MATPSLTSRHVPVATLGTKQPCTSGHSLRLPATPLRIGHAHRDGTSGRLGPGLLGRKQKKGLRCMDTEDSATGGGEARFSSVTVTLEKPMGLVLAEMKGGGVFVEEIVPGGNADMSGLVRVGDILSECSAVVLKSGREIVNGVEGHGDTLYDNWERVWFNAEGQDFSTVMSAIGSNNERWGYSSVGLKLKRPLEQQ